VELALSVTNAQKIHSLSDYDIGFLNSQHRNQQFEPPSPTDDSFKSRLAAPSQ
jgi:hypothetical protein